MKKDELNDTYLDFIFNLKRKIFELQFCGWFFDKKHSLFFEVPVVFLYPKENNKIGGIMKRIKSINVGESNGGIVNSNDYIIITECKEKYDRYFLIEDRKHGIETKVDYEYKYVKYEKKLVQVDVDESYLKWAEKNLPGMNS